MDQAQSSRTLDPTHYHTELLSYLKENETAVWEWSVSQPAQDEHAAEVRESLLKYSYRLNPESHKTVFDLCRRAMAILDIEAPVNLYQIANEQMNASLCFIQSEIHIVFHGPILEKLSDDELLALLGHELSHYLLWSSSNGEYHAVVRILDHTLSYPIATPSHYESARLYRLFTELYADRGAALVCGDSKPAIACMVKIMTGLSDVDADAYLDQLGEIKPSKDGSQENTHPEIFVRAQAVSKWWNSDEDILGWLNQELRGEPDLDSIDLIMQAELSHLTCSFLQQFRDSLGVESDPLDSAVQGFADTLDSIRLTNPPVWSPETKMSETIRDYFFALIMDLSMADPEIRDTVLEAGASLAHRMGELDGFRAVLKRDLKLRQPTITRLTKNTRKIN